LKTKYNHTLFTLLLKRLVVVFILFFICRCIYLGYNYHYLPHGFVEIAKSFLFGIIFDASAIAYIFSPFILASIFPFKWQESLIFQKIIKIIFLFIAILCTIANIADTIYFKFSRKRSGIDVFRMLDDKGNPLFNYLNTYWPWILITIVLILLTNYTYTTGLADLKKSFKKWWFYLVVIIGFGLAARGSIGLKPLKTFDAARFVNPELVPLTVNTPFNLISTFQGTAIDKQSYFKDSVAKKILPVTQSYFIVNKTPLKPNICIIILESFSRDYCGWLRGKPSFTPFLDSLSLLSLNFTNFYANGSVSMDGLPAIIAGMPNLLEVPYINSSYQDNKIKNIGKLLSNIGYKNHFYHGADNGTMGFNNFMKISGWQNYNGIEQYPNKNRDYDGAWGIFDEPYFEYVADEMKKMEKPFITSIFSLSSHDPYPMPDKYKDKFAGGDLPIYKTIEYTDFALRTFFKKISTESWFKNTIFFITADHSSHSKEEYFYSPPGKYEIPLLIYNPGHGYIKPGIAQKTTNQIDILPTVMDIVNFPYPFFALGRSMLDGQQGFAYQKNGSVFQIISYPYIAQLKPDGKFIFFKQYKDVMERHYDLFPEEFIIRNLMLKKLLAFIQLHHNNLVDNTFYIE